MKRADELVFGDRVLAPGDDDARAIVVDTFPAGHGQAAIVLVTDEVRGEAFVEVRVPVDQEFTLW